MKLRQAVAAQLLLGLLFCGSIKPVKTLAQSTSPSGMVTVDDQGVMRWESGEEVYGFGVNYTVPFAHAFRSAKKLGVDPLEAIDQDIYHFKRLGFDLYRCHVWDTEISDTLGNLLYNEHLHAFDYLLYKLAQNDINYVLTPIAYWGNGWPEPDYPTPGFSHKYGKSDCLTNPEAIKAQENYLTQFMNHVNPYTGVAYKDDPHVVAVEISNEPHHGGEGEAVTAFVDKMVRAVRKSGYQKPVFYNISHSVHFVNDYFAGGIDGGTFQWYPTGLTYQSELPINALPNVDHYRIPFEADIKKHSGAKLVYEFDAADINKTYPYAAMARSFRTAGIQIATHFSYDPTFLAYTPGKALSLMIASEVFHRIPMYKNFGSYPDNTTFDDFRVSYEEDLAQLNTNDKFYYTNDTGDQPVAPDALRHLAGVGQSPVVRYDGTGAYFLDKLSDNSWRLEVLPDALTVQNPFGRNALDKTVGVIQWNDRSMTIDLKSVGKSFTLTPINDGNTYTTTTSDGSFRVRPGVYVVSEQAPSADVLRNWESANPHLRSFAGPESTVDRDYLTHTPVRAAPAGKDIPIEVQVTSPRKKLNVQVFIGDRWQGTTIDLKHTGGFTYEGSIPDDQVRPGTLNYYLVVHHEHGTRTFPADAAGSPFDWDFHQRNPYEVTITPADKPIVLFSAGRDAYQWSQSRWSRGQQLVEEELPGVQSLEVNLEEVFQIPFAPKEAGNTRDFTIRHFTKPLLKAFGNTLREREKLIVHARALNDKPVHCQIALTTDKGTAYGYVLKVEPGKERYEIALADLRPVPMVTMPRPYPTFLPYYLEGERREGNLDLSSVESVQWSLGPGITPAEAEKRQGVAVTFIMLE
jgi:hypothetical protein